jgi:hypothetical protein
VLKRPNIEKLTAKGNTKGLIKALSYREDKDIRKAAAEALGQIGDARAVQPLNETLLKDTYSYSSNLTIRKAAAEALGQIGDAQAISFLREAMRKESCQVQIRLICYSVLDQTHGAAISKADEKDLVEATAAKIRSLYGRTTIKTNTIIKDWKTEEIVVGKEWGWLDVGGPYQGWVDVVETRKVPAHQYTTQETVPNPDYRSIEEIIALIPNKIYDQVFELSGGAKHLFKR